MVLNFKEYWGYAFAQEKDLINGPAYKAKGVRSKYQGPAYKNNEKKLYPDKMYGFDIIDKAKINSRKLTQ